MDSRGPFVKVVFGLLFVCMLATLGFGVVTFTVPGVRLFFRSVYGLGLAVVALVVLVIALYIIFCSPCGKQIPCNIICLVLVVVCECIAIGLITAKYDLIEVLMALGVTTGIVFFCFCLAFTPLDFTKCYMFLIVAGLVLLLFSITVMVMMLVFHQEFIIVRLVLCGLFTLYHAISFVMTIQMVLGGKTIELEEDDYVAGTVTLYMSIIVIFLDILQMIGLVDSLLNN